MVAVNGGDEKMGFALEQRKSWRIGPKNIDFSDDIALLSEDIRTATELLYRIESAAAAIEFFIKVDTTKVMNLNLGDHLGDLQSCSGEAIESLLFILSFIYLCSWIDETEREIKVRKGKTWAAFHRLKNTWKSKLSKKLKIRFFIAACELVLLHTSEAGTMKTQEKCLDGTHTKILQMVLGISWKHKVSIVPTREVTEILRQDQEQEI